jgi:hypothetical protein
MLRKLLHHHVKCLLVTVLALTACAPAQQLPQPTVTPIPETILPTFTPTSAPAAPAPWSIFANQGWQAAHTFVHPGDELEITATGAWSHDPDDPQFSNPYGPGGVEIFESGVILPSAPIGSLLGRIGDSPPFVIGEHLVLNPAYRGELWLSMNDSPDRFSDNTGYVGVTVRLIPKPPVPGTPLTNIAQSYYLVYPPGYYVLLTEKGICLTQNNQPIAGACELPNTASLEVSDANGRTVAQLADQIITVGDLNFRFDSYDMLVDGEPAVWISREGGDGILNLVIIVHRDRVYTWGFRSRYPIPSLGQEAQVMEEMNQVQNLYDTVISSFQFLE